MPEAAQPLSGIQLLTKNGMDTGYAPMRVPV